MIFAVSDILRIAAGNYQVCFTLKSFSVEFVRFTINRKFNFKKHLTRRAQGFCVC